jgi:hypothetical protein
MIQAEQHAVAHRPADAEQLLHNLQIRRNQAELTEIRIEPEIRAGPCKAPRRGPAERAAPGIDSMKPLRPKFTDKTYFGQICVSL